MNTIVQFPDAEARIRAAIDAGILKRGTWGNGTDAVCMMSAVVSGADGMEACVTAGWPEWLVEVNVALFDADVGADDEDAAATTFSLDLFKAAALPFDADKARDRFLIRRLDTGDHSALKSLRLNRVDADWWRDCEAAITAVVALLHRRIAGEDVAPEMKAAYDAAYAAADAAYAAAADAARAARAAADAARAAAYAARAYAADAARAAASGAYAAADAAYAAAVLAAYAAAADAAYAAEEAARADLVTAITESRIAA